MVLREELDAAARWRKRLTLLSDACQRLGTDAVDLVVLEDAPAPLGHRVLKWGRLLREPLPHRRADVAERILRCYLDEAYLRRVLDTGLAARLREKRFARDPVVVRRRLRAMERSLRTLRSLRARGRDARTEAYARRSRCPSSPARTSA